MRYVLKSVIIVLFVTAVSCSARNNAASGDYIIRYINLNSIYEYCYSNSNEAQDIKRKTDALNKKISELENSGGGSSKTELDFYRSEIVKIKEQEKRLKTEMYSRIKTAVNNIAAKHNADFVLNSGEGVIYSKPAYDITGDVIKELKSLEIRTSPVYK